MASKLIPLFLILLTIPAASAAQEAKTAIEKGSKAWEDAYNEGDASVVMGDMAVEVGTYVSTGPDDELVGGGKYLLVWKRMDTGWKISYDIFNSSR